MAFSLSLAAPPPPLHVGELAEKRRVQVWKVCICRPTTTMCFVENETLNKHETRLLTSQSGKATVQQVLW